MWYPQGLIEFPNSHLRYDKKVSVTKGLSKQAIMQSIMCITGKAQNCLKTETSRQIIFTVREEKNIDDELITWEGYGEYLKEDLRQTTDMYWQKKGK